MARVCRNGEKRNSEKPTADNTSEAKRTVSETDKTARCDADQYGTEPTFEQMQEALTGLYD